MRLKGIRVSYHGENCILVDGDGKWITGSIKPDHAEAIVARLAVVEDLRRGCQAALAYLADPPSKFKSNRDEAVRIILQALAKAKEVV